MSMTVHTFLKSFLLIFHVLINIFQNIRYLLFKLNAIPDMPLGIYKYYLSQLLHGANCDMKQLGNVTLCWFIHTSRVV